MKVSLNWVKKYVDLKEDFKHAAICFGVKSSFKSTYFFTQFNDTFIFNLLFKLF